VRLKRQVFVTTTSLVLVSAMAKAEPDAAQQALANQLFDDAEKLMAANRMSEACPKYAESQHLDPQLGTLLHLGACYEKVGKTASAWSSFKDAADIAARRHDERESTARHYIASLEARLSKLTIEVTADAPTGLEVKKDGDPLGRAVWGSPVPIDPGPHVITARAPGYKDWQTTIDVPSGASSVRASIPKLELTAASLSPTSQNPQYGSSLPPAPIAEQHQGSSSVQRTMGFVAGGVGIAGLVVGTVSAISLNAKSSDRNHVNACSATHSCTSADQDRVNQLTNDMRSNATWAGIGLIGGGVAVIGGTLLVLTAPSAAPKPARAHRIDVQPWIGKSSTGIALGGVW